MAATIKTRVQLKCDTEAHWSRATNFIPLKGEVIIYSADDTHPFSRLKAGDGVTTVRELPFIDSGTVDGFVLKETFDDFPRTGKANTLYLEISTATIYEWTNAGGYEPKYGLKKQTVNTISSWDAGTMTNLFVQDGTATLKVINGIKPTLIFEDVEVATGFDSL